MKSMMAAAMLAGILLCAPAGAAAQEGDDLWSRQINRETAGQWNVMPERPAPRVVASSGVPGDAALRVRVPRASGNPWDIQASSPIGGAINAGDIILVAFYARAEQPAPNGSVLPVRLQMSGAPYTAVLEGAKTIDGEWRQHCLWGAATQSLAAGASNVSLHLANAQQVIDLGPVFVFNLGPDFDRAQLPACG